MDMKDMPPSAHCVHVTQHIQYCIERLIREDIQDVMGAQRMLSHPGGFQEKMWRGNVFYIFIYRGQPILKRKHSLLA